MSTILQLTDLHVEPRGVLAYGKADTASRLDAIRPWLEVKAREVDLIVVTGDIACDGNVESYRHVREVFSGLAAPVRMLPGNHDSRTAMRAHLEGLTESSEEVSPSAPVEFLFETDDFRAVGLDTLIPGTHWGEAKDASLARLEALFNADRRAGRPKPTILFMHHTPLHSGMPKMDESFGNRDALLRVLAARSDVRVATGHMHRAIVGLFGANVVVTAPPVALSIELDFGPEGGDAFRLEPPGFALHKRIDSAWVTHTGLIPVVDDFSGPYPFAGAVNPID